MDAIPASEMRLQVAFAALARKVALDLPEGLPAVLSVFRQHGVSEAWAEAAMEDGSTPMRAFGDDPQSAQSLSSDLASLAARWREKAKSVSRFGSLAVPQRFIAFALEECADDLAALRGMTKEEVDTRTGELAVDPAPQHAATDSEG